MLAAAAVMDAPGLSSTTLTAGQPSTSKPSSHQDPNISRSDRLDRPDRPDFARHANRTTEDTSTDVVSRIDKSDFYSNEQDRYTSKCRAEVEDLDHSRLITMSPSLIGKTVTPFLREHIPSLYAPIGKDENEEISKEKDPNTKYCYRHRPDSKCRRAADESKMEMIQSVCSTSSYPLHCSA